MIFNVYEIAKNDWSPYCLDYTVVIDIFTSQKSSVLEMDFDDSNDSNESSDNVYTCIYVYTLYRFKEKTIKHRHAVMIISEFDDITGSVHPIQARDFGPNHIQLSHRPKRGRKEKQRRVLRRFALTKKNCKNRFLLTRSDLSKSTSMEGTPPAYQRNSKSFTTGQMDRKNQSCSFKVSTVDTESNKEHNTKTRRVLINQLSVRLTGSRAVSHRLT